MSKEQGLRYLILKFLFISCTTFKGLEGQKKKGDMEMERGLVSCVWAGGGWHSGGDSVCERRLAWWWWG